VSGPGRTASATAHDDGDLPAGAGGLFARKGAAAPAPAQGGRPAGFRPDGDASNDANRVTGGAGPDPGPIAERTDKTAIDTETAPPPAASLDAAPFDPARRKPAPFDDMRGAGETGQAVPAVRRRGLPTTVLAGAATAIAMVAIVAALDRTGVIDRPTTRVTRTETVVLLPPEAAPSTAETAIASTGPEAAGAAATAPQTVPDIPPPAGPQPPVIDLVRLESDGSTIIAGRAMPGTALIVLDNDEAIGSAVAGETGDWMLIPDRPLAGGAHEIALAVKAGGGAVNVETPPATGRATPIPRPAGVARYVVQVASVTSAAGAAEEWDRLKAALPALLGNLEPRIDAADLGGRGTYYRIRLGPFGDRNEAHALCAALTGAGRACLVVRR
jgi:hypothetical protein